MSEAAAETRPAGTAATGAAVAPTAAPPAVAHPPGQRGPADLVPASFGQDIDLVLDIPVQVSVELGRTKISIRDILQLTQGSVIELDGLAGEPLNVLVNGCLVAQGEVVVVNDRFGIRLTDIIAPAERMRRLQR